MNEILYNRIKGIFYGQAIGDALGLGTEFLSKDQVKEYYPNGLAHYSQIFQDKHRSRWEMGDWTDDTDQFICICNSIIKTGKVDELAFAEELYAWFKDKPLGIGHTVLKVLSLPQFTKSPHKGAELIWKLSRNKSASNGAIMRTSILGIYEFWDYDKVVFNTENICKVTHWDPRCVGSCVIVNAIISEILHNDRMMNSDEVIQIGEKYDHRIKEFVGLSLSKNIADLNLAEPNSIGYTLKAMAAGLWAYFNASDFETGIFEIINQGGDADTNASVAGSLLGAKFGFNSLPSELVDGLLYKDLLEEKFNAFIDRLIQIYPY